MSVQPAVVDSPGWIEVFTDGPQASGFLDVLDAESALIVPAISILEVFMWVLREHSEAQAIQAVAAMQRGQVVNLDSSLAIAAAQLSHTLRLPMADSIILATARIHHARLCTMDADFQGLNDVELMAKQG
ncbi:type II toxin-antitoxin system VapC family toxin [Cyanobium sp. CH-040]|uniref:type II toxin-antitoxin system VapC family toxin n=1 Tax=Cyanobium sp. CH-040 TaxID=2823708 RepID=UPI0020CC7617|nr:type II toxin-antitoxin system VapC family toxin [Cyanobium sp. CH-040]MCP9927884.1 type II toxin-antitoxin system VapC family toxin [Cyanobium sp. CH-040]